MTIPGSGAVERHPAVAFVAVAYAVSWGCWGVWGALTDAPSLLKTVLFVAGGFGPFVAALVVRATRGRPLRPWLARVLRVRVGVRWYLFALSVPLVALAAAGAVHAVGLGGRVTPDLLPSPVEYPVFLLFVVLFGGGQEEPGWRGFLQPALEEHHAALVAALVVGVVWAIWHWPLFVLPGTVQNDVVPWLYLPQLVAMSVVLAWLTTAARGSVLPAVLLHAGGNVIANFYPVGGVAGAVSVTGYGLLTGVVILAAILLVVRDGLDLQRAGDGTPAD